jgi:sterol desaturase/sphingolipid hydroxylase (fatty acid hydroxylase superfamily)
MDAIVDTVLGLGNAVIGVIPRTVAFGILFAVLCALFPCNPGKPWWRKPEIVTDLFWWFLFPLIGRYMSIALLLLGGGLLVLLGAAPERLLGPDFGPLAGLPFWLQAVIYLIAADLLLYVTHRAFHGASLWRFHAIHHSSENLDWISANRFHPVDQLLHSALPDAVLLLLGIPSDVIIAIAPFQAWHGALIHANLNWDFGPFRYLLVSPVYHRWHHTDVARGGSKNFAATFPLFDVLFGTVYMPRGVLPDGYGVDNPDFPKDAGGQLLYPFRQGEPRPTGVGAGP